MATTAITVEQYLETSYHPDRDYVNGEVLVRNLGEKEHSLLQGFLSMWFGIHRHEWDILVLPEQRVQAETTRFRVPDMTLVRRQDNFERWVKRPPLLCIEILSPENRIARTLPRLEDYWRMGVENIWVIDPEERKAWTYSGEGLEPVQSGRLAIPASPIHLPLPDVWAELD